MFKIEGFINPDHIFFQLKAGSKKGILKEMVKKICEVDKIKDHEDGILKHVLDRERIESTGIGESFAIPHCHYSGFKGVQIYVGFPKNQIDFKSVDGAPVRVIFMIISDNKSNDIYLKTLSRLMYILRNIQIREKLFSLNSKEDFLKIVKHSDQQIEYISYSGLKQLISLLELENEIETYTHETLIVKGKRQGKADLKEDSHFLSLRENCDKMIEQIDNRLLQIYNQLKTKFNGDILSRVNRNVCSYCNVQLPIHIIREIKRQNQIIQCSTCSKILVLR